MNRIVLTLVMSLGIAATSCARAATDEPVSRPTRAEVLDAAQRLTGMSTDLMDALDNEVFGTLLGDVGNHLHRLKLLDYYLTAKDEEAFDYMVQQLFDELLEKVTDRLLSEMLKRYLSALSAYREALELVRDFVVVPALDERVYRAYAERRGQPNTTYTPEEAFEELAYGTFGNWTGVTYFALRDRMLAELMRVRGLNPRLIGEAFENSLKKDLDQYWTKRLEARFQREQIAAQAAPLAEIVRRELERGAMIMKRADPAVLRRIKPTFPADMPGGAFMPPPCDNWQQAAQERCEGLHCTVGATLLNRPPAAMCASGKPADFTYTVLQIAATISAQPAAPQGGAQSEIRVDDWTLQGVLEDDLGAASIFTEYYRGFSLRLAAETRREGPHGSDKLPSQGAALFFMKKMLSRVDGLYADGTLKE